MRSIAIDVKVMLPCGGLLIGYEGRKTWTATTAYGADGRELGRASATWIAITPASR